MAEEGYNGWTNYETFLLMLNLDNDQGTYNMMIDLVHDLLEGNEDCDTYDFGQALKDNLEELFWVEEYGIYKICDTWTTRDWAEIDWYQIGEAYMEEHRERS